MARLLYIHWHADEAVELAAPLAAAGHDVRIEHSAAGLDALDGDPPAAVVISLRRLPSHGREVAAAIRDRTSTATLPIVFVAGEPTKVSATRRRFPDATYVETEATIAL